MAASANGAREDSPLTRRVAIWALIVAAIFLLLAFFESWLRPLEAIAGLLLLVLIQQGLLSSWIKHHFDAKLAQRSHELSQQLEKERAELAIGLNDLRHEQAKRLEDYKLGPATLLALFTQRAGTLSEVQLKAAQETWNALNSAHVGLAELISPLKSVAVEPSMAHDPEAVKRALLSQEEKLRQRVLLCNQDLADAVRKHKPFLPKSLFARVHAYVEKHEQMVAHLEEHREFKESLPGVPLEDRPAAVETTKELGRQSARFAVELAELAQAVEDEIRELTTPRLDFPRQSI
jgi:hypothetical protein